MSTDEYLRAASLKRLNPWWAKGEIVVGLSVAVVGLVQLRDRTAGDVLSGAMVVLGLYLAMAGHRSHLYQSMNRQGAFLWKSWRRDRPP